VKTIFKAHPITGIGLLLLLMFFCAQTASAQNCDKVRIDYVIRDSKGHIIDASTLKPSDFVEEKADKYYERSTRQISFSGTGDVKSAATITSLHYENRDACTFKLDELTLRMGGKTMHLIFNLSLNSYHDSAHSQKVIDSLPFKQGTFRLEATSENNIPASSWKKVSNNP
jgi:hypothetical protein